MRPVLRQQKINIKMPALERQTGTFQFENSLVFKDASVNIIKIACALIITPTSA